MGLVFQADRPPPAILQGIRDQHGNHWVRYGTSDRHILLSIAELQRDPNAVFARLICIGKRALTNRAKEGVRQEIEAFDRYEDAIVISCNGWTDGLFRYADGATFSPPARKSAVVAAFDTDAKAGWSGDLASWQTAISPFAEHQPLVQFVLAYAFVGALLAFAPVDIQNPIIELVGSKQMGKTTLGILAGSVWGGHPDSSCGFGITWDLTAGAIDQVMERHRDQLLYLEETNLAGKSDAERATFIEQALFKLTSSQPRLRLGEAGSLTHVRTAVLSTGNTPMRQLIGFKKESKQAALSRVLTLFANRQFGVLDTVPSGYASAGEAIRALHHAAAHFYGSAGRRFVQALADRNASGGLPQEVTDCYNKFLRHPVLARFGEGRLTKIVAVTCAAHEIATYFGILPSKWGPILDAISALDFDVPSNTEQAETAIERLRGYVHDQGQRILQVQALRRPLSAKEFEEAAGVRSAAGVLLIATVVFQTAFPHWREMLQELRAFGVLLPEGGSKPKSSQKVPAAVCSDHGRRAYFFKL